MSIFSSVQNIPSGEGGRVVCSRGIWQKMLIFFTHSTFETNIYHLQGTIFRCILFEWGMGSEKVHCVHLWKQYFFVVPVLSYVLQKLKGISDKLELKCLCDDVLPYVYLTEVVFHGNTLEKMVGHVLWVGLSRDLNFPWTHRSFQNLAFSDHKK